MSDVAPGSPSEWERLSEEFLSLEHEPAAIREARLAALHSAGDPIHDRLQAMLLHDSRPSPLLDAPPGDLAARLLRHPAEDDVRGARFGPYRVEAELGAGGMGVVYLAVRDDIGIRVALKVLWDAPIGADRTARFVDEQRILARLRHPGIVPIFDGGVRDDGTPWFAMEHVVGETLVAYRRNRRLDARASVALFCEVARAVAAAHQQLVVHGDLKPSNVLVEPDGRVRLLDFGVAAPLDEAPGRRTRALTPAYAAPEQHDGAPLNVLTDVHALGVLLFELLAGRLPASAGEPLPAVAELDAADLDAVCRRARALTPNDRYATVDAMVGDLGRILRHEPLALRGAAPGYRARKFLRRHRRPLAIAGVLLATVGGGALEYGRRLQAADRAADEEAARTARIQRFVLNLVAGGNEAVGAPDTLRVVTLLDAGLRDAAVLGDDPETRAQLLLTLGSSFRTLGKLERADSVLIEGLRTPRLPDASTVRAPLLAELALSRSDAAAPDSAKVLSRRAVAQADSSGAPDAVRARVWESVGRVYEAASTYDTAVTALQRAVQLRTAIGDTSSSAFAELLIHLADNHYYRSEFDSATAIARRVIAASPAVLPPGHPSVADAWLTLGAITKDRGETAQALDFTQRGAEMMERWYGAQHHRTARAWGLLGRAHFSAGDYAESERWIRKALTVREAVFGPNHPLVATLLNELGNIASMRDDYPAAEAVFRRILSIYRTVYNGRHHYIGLFQGNLASALMSQGDYRGAERELREGLAMYALTLPADHLNVAVHHVRLGRALQLQQRHREAITETERGMAILERQATRQVAWLQNAWTTLDRSFTALGDTARAGFYRRELADTTSR